MDEQKTKYCDMENGCMFCDRLFCEGKKEEQSNDSQNGQTKGLTKCLAQEVDIAKNTDFGRIGKETYFC